MLLKTGVVMMASAVVLAVVAAVVLNLPGRDPAQAVAPVEPQNAGVPLMPELRDPPRAEPTESQPQESKARPEVLPVAARDWPNPSERDLTNFDGPRRYEPIPGAIMTLTVPALGLVDAPVLNSAGQQALDSGVIHLPQTPMPWDGGEQKNVYLAGHRIGYPGTGSRMIFYNLGSLQRGDRVTVRDLQGRTYGYAVSEVFVVGPRDTWVADPVRGRDMITLQTCTPVPTFENRLIIRADRI